MTDLLERKAAKQKIGKNNIKDRLLGQPTSTNSQKKQPESAHLTKQNKTKMTEKKPPAKISIRDLDSSYAD